MSEHRELPLPPPADVGACVAGGVYVTRHVRLDIYPPDRAEEPRARVPLTAQEARSLARELMWCAAELERYEARKARE